LAVKAMIFDLPWADAGFGSGNTLIYKWGSTIEAEILFPLYWAMSVRDFNLRDRLPPQITLLRLSWNEASKRIPSTDLSTIHAKDSGQGALNLAYLKRARHVVLFGLDFCTRQSPDGRVMFHANHNHYESTHWQPRCAGNSLSNFARNVDRIAPEYQKRGMEIINASPDSRLTAFPKCTVEEGILLASRA
jgi:hypothetical protein